MTRESDLVDFRILGPLEVASNGDNVPLGGGKQRALLAVLLLHADRVVPVERIIDDLWGESVPDTAPKMVQVYVSQLRKQLPGELLRTRAPGYVLELDGHALDLHRFDELVEQGRAALANGQPEQAARELRAALDLWRGSALAEFEEPFAQLESARLEEQRVVCLEERIEADLALGRHAQLVGELESLVRRLPHRERLRGQHMLALYRSGRQAEALESYGAFRRMLSDDLGIDPSPALRELERQILQQAPSLELDQPAFVTAPTPPRSASAPPVGRERERAHLSRLLEEACSGTRHLVFVTGDPGIGKTTIVESFVGELAATDTLVARGQCVPQQGGGEPYLAVLQALGELVRGPRGRQFVSLLARQAPTWVAQMPWILSDEEFEAVRVRLIGATTDRMLREMVEALEAMSRETPLVLVLEDLHWSDPSTVDLLNAVARRRESARLLVVGTYRRTDAVAQEHPVHRLAQQLRGRGLATEIAVGPLSLDAVDEYAASRVGAKTSRAVAGVLRERTGGNPLFVTTLLDSWLDDDLLAEDPDLEQLGRHVPETVRDLIDQMLDDLDSADAELLTAASVVGLEFSPMALAAAATREETEVETRCDALAHSGRFIERAGEEQWPDSTVDSHYRFAHDLHREVLYDRLPAGQRAQTHLRVGLLLESKYGERAKEIAPKLAEHFVRGGDAARAVVALRLAAEQAFERLAHREALEHLTNALAMLERLPDDDHRASEELTLQAMLAFAQLAVRGFSAPEAEAAFVRARELAERLGRTDEHGWALFRLGTLYEVRGEYHRSREFVEQALAVAEQTSSKGLLLESHELLACVLFHQGVFGEAVEHAERGLAAYDGQYSSALTAAYGENAGAACHTWAALSLWFAGFPDLARKRARDAIAVAEDARRRHGRATALAHSAIVEQCRLDVDAARERAENAMGIAAEDGYRYRLAMATIVHGWAIAAAGSCEEGVAEVERGLELSRATGARMDDPYYLALLADARMRAGNVDAACAAVEAAFEQAPPGRGFFFESELYRLGGELELRRGSSAKAEERFKKAVEVARAQNALSLELRAALSLASLLRETGRDDEARDLVAEPFSRFTEGFDTHDLIAARQLLKKLTTA